MVVNEKEKRETDGIERLTVRGEGNSELVKFLAETLRREERAMLQSGYSLTPIPKDKVSEWSLHVTSQEYSVRWGRGKVG